jgi:hypothetical protein
LIADSQKLPAVQIKDGLMQLTYTQAQGASLIYTVKATIDLNAAWSSAGVNQGIPTPTGLTTATLPMAVANVGFLRLEVQLAP